MDSRSQLLLRKAELKAKIERQQLEIKATFQELRNEFEPDQLIKKAAGSFLKSSGAAGPGIAFLADLLFKDRRLALLAKVAAPLFFQFFSNRKKATGSTSDQPALPLKAGIYSSLRKNVASLRSHLKKRPETPPEIEPTNET